MTPREMHEHRNRARERAPDGAHRWPGAPGGQHGVAADVEALVADLHDAAHDHVVDPSRVEVVALGESGQDLAGEIGGVPPGELAVALATSGAHHVDDHGVGHGGLLGGCRETRPVGQVHRAVTPGTGQPFPLIDHHGPCGQRHGILVERAPAGPPTRWRGPTVGEQRMTREELDAIVEGQTVPALFLEVVAQHGDNIARAKA